MFEDLQSEKGPIENNVRHNYHRINRVNTRKRYQKARFKLMEDQFLFWKKMYVNLFERRISNTKKPVFKISNSVSQKYFISINDHYRFNIYIYTIYETNVNGILPDMKLSVQSYPSEVLWTIFLNNSVKRKSHAQRDSEKLCAFEIFM